MSTPEAHGREVRPPERAVRVFILNDHKLVRQGLRDLLENEGFHIAGESGSAAEGGDLVPALKPDVAVVDDRLPDGTGIEVCRDLRDAAPEVACLILTGYDDEQAVRAAVLAGASGYVLKQIRNNELSSGVRSAAAGQTLIRPRVRERAAEGLRATAAAPWMGTMTRKERDVLALITRGLTNRQIGQEMLLPDEAVKDCVSSVLEKLGFRRGSPLARVPKRNVEESRH